MKDRESYVCSDREAKQSMLSPAAFDTDAELEAIEAQVHVALILISPKLGQTRLSILISYSLNSGGLVTAAEAVSDR